MSSARAERLARLSQLPLIDASPPSRGFFAGFYRAVRIIFGRRRLLNLLVRRELKVRYKDSSLGFLWSLIKPLTLLFIYYVAIGQFLGAARSVPDFGIFVFAGLTLWSLYSETLNTGTMSIVRNAGLVKKVYFPREIFPLAATGSAIFNFLVQFSVLLATTLVLGKFPVNWNLLYVPVAIAIVLVYAVAVTILLSALNVFLRDIQYLVEVSLMVLFWASPIVYAWAFVVDAGNRVGAWVTELYLLNPISTAILAFQKAMWEAGTSAQVVGTTSTGEPRVIPPQPWPDDLNMRLGVGLMVGLLLLVLAQRIFARLQGNFAQEL